LPATTTEWPVVISSEQTGRILRVSRPAVYLFGPFALDATAFRLTREGQSVSASPKVLDLLRYLLDRPSALVTKDELFKAIWPDVIVTDNALTQAVSELRQLLGDDPAKPTYIQTVARRGYRFVAAVQTTMAPAQNKVPAIEPEFPAIAVLDFTNLTRDASVEWLSTGIAETVTNDLRSLDGVRVIDRVRVVESAKRAGGALDRIGTDLGVRMAIVGSFQKAGDRLRITARAVDVASSEVVADAKADGPMSGVFELQDRIFNEMAGALGAHGRSHDRTPLETSSIDAYRAFTEGRVVLETLDASAIPQAIAHFERAIEIDERYPQAHVGLANARFFQYELSRAQNHPDGALLATAIAHARRAIEIDRNFAESHATLSFLLVSAGRSAEAKEAARRAVRLEAPYWGHHFRLAHATWGDERLAALTRTLELYPQFPFAHFEIAMVHIARGALDHASSVLREGAVVQDQQADRRQRYPAKGLHWLLGLVRLAAGDLQEATMEFDREINGSGGQLYAAEFRMNACDGAGFAMLRAQRTTEAAAMFRRALEHYPDHARSLLGLASALRAAGDVAASDAALARAAAAIDALRLGGRGSEATLSEAFAHAVAGRAGDAVAMLHRLLDEADLPFTGWTIPIEPLLEPLHGHEGFAGVLKKLQDRAS
jgi:DNA-binding winged helix-turn-helix (wHTH) protein/tetratricopeptide (TPR) repeat protein